MSRAAGVRPYGNNDEHLDEELRWLDLLIRLRTRTLALQNQATPEAQVARTVYIAPGDVDWMLENSETTRASDTTAEDLRKKLARLRNEIDTRIADSLQARVFLTLPHLCTLFGLSTWERQAIVICLAPDLRRKYDRLYAYLQDDITRKRPSVALVLDLVCNTDAQRWNARHLLSENASLLRAKIVRRIDDPHSPSGSTGLAQFLALDPRICDFLLGSSQLDTRLIGKTQFLRPSPSADEVPVDSAIIAGVWRLVAHHLGPNGNGGKLVLHLHGPSGVGKRELALHLCRRLGSSLLTVDVETLLPRGTEGEDLLRLAFREGLLQQASLYLEHAHVLLQDAARPLLQALQMAISEYGFLVFLSAETEWTRKQPFTGCVFHSVALPLPDVLVRAAVWRGCLTSETPEAVACADRMAADYRLTPGEIRASVDLARNRLLMQAAPRPMTAIDLAKACRERSNHNLQQFAAKIQPHCGWDDLVLPVETLAHLREICSHVRHQHKVFADWGFGRKVSRGRGVCALFSGPSGTGKTMAAEVLAHELELDLYKVDLSGVVSKYIGETEKNLSRIFLEAETSNAILFFDEADALFAKRTEVSDAHDRYANIETSFLLQKMEAYDGIVILATNLRDNMDEAFTRRIRFIVEFLFPDEASRLRIWRTHLPTEAPVSPEIDFAGLAREFQVAGGSIKNIVLNSAFAAAKDDGPIGMEHIMRGAKREFEKIGKLWNEQRSFGALKQ